MAVLAANIGHGQHRLSDGLLDAQAELRASRRSIVILVQASDVIDRDRIAGIVKPVWRLVLGSDRDTLLKFDARRKRNSSRVVVHVVALDALVHDAVAAPDHGLAIASYIIGKSKTRSEVRPRIVHAPFRNPANVADADSIQIELLTRKNRVRAGPKSRAESANGLIARIEYGRICGVIQAG